MNVEIEKITNSLKGIASILFALSEVPKGTIIWNEWAMYLLNKELSEDIEKLEKIAKEM